LAARASGSAVEHFGLARHHLPGQRAGRRLPDGRAGLHRPGAGKALPGAHGSTFGGNPLAARPGWPRIQTYQDEGLIDRAAQMGAYLLAELRAALDGIALVREIRGLG
jgi:acetylornithine/N-succinyldiaminopimelate aminotransferase